MNGGNFLFYARVIQAMIGQDFECEAGPAMPDALIAAIASHLPEQTLTNETLAERHGSWTAEQIMQKVGIRERRIAAPEECASDLAVKAVQRLFEEGRLTPGEVDYVLYCTQSPDYLLPTTACLLQKRLGLPRSCGALDFNLGCSGFVYGLSLAKGLVASGQARCILLVTAETYSKFIHPRDFSVCALFGDAAAATVIRAAEEGGEGDGGGSIGQFVFGTDGGGGGNLIVPTGGLRRARTAETAAETTDKDGNTRSQDNLYMNGREIFLFAIQQVPRAIAALLAKTGLTLEEIDQLVLHQANRFMLDELVRKIPFPREKTPYEFEDIGNTVSCTIPIALERLASQGRLQRGNRLVLVGFGVGYSWGACTVEWR